MGTKTLTKKTLLLRERLKESVEQTKHRQMRGQISPNLPVSASASASARPSQAMAASAPAAPVSVTAAPTTVADKASTVSTVSTASTVTGPQATQNPLSTPKPAQTKPPVADLVQPADGAPGSPAATPTAAKERTGTAKTSTGKTPVEPEQKAHATSISSTILARLPKSTSTRLAGEKSDDVSKKGDQAPTDMRFSRRKATDLAGYVCNEGNTIKIPVVINDLSATGARFTLDRKSHKAFNSTPAIAEKFQLYIIYDRLYVRCKTQWRDGNSYGVRYLSAPQFY